MDSKALLALAGRVEGATAGDRELDLDILKALGGCHWGAHLIDDMARSSGPPGTPIPAYTASLDAAMTLVPEGWSWDADATVPKYGVDWQLWSPNDPPKRVEATARTPALALAAACLRALATSEPS